MKQAFWKLTFALAIVISVTGIKGEAGTNQNNSWQISQSSEITNNQQLGTSREKIIPKLN